MTSVDRLGILNEELRILEGEKNKIVKELKLNMEGNTSYGKRYFVTITDQERTSLDRDLIPAEILKKATIRTTTRVLRCELRVKANE